MEKLKNAYKGTQFLVFDMPMVIEICKKCKELDEVLNSIKFPHSAITLKPMARKLLPAYTLLSSGLGTDISLFNRARFLSIFFKCRNS